MPTLIAPQSVVALGMTAYVRAGFALRTFGAEHLRSDRGTIVAASHRTDYDVPVLSAALAWRWARAVAQGRPWPTFVARDDLFLRGFLAGWQPGVPIGVRRALFKVRISRPLERLQCVPVREPGRMRLVELLLSDPARDLEGWLPIELERALLKRARGLGRPQPRTGGDVIDAAYADVLWEPVDRDQTHDADAAWRAHLDRALADFRRIVEIVRRGDYLVIFPEGDTSPDGQIGPIRPGLGSLVRRGGARLIQPVSIAYDPLTAGRTRAYVAVGRALEVTSPTSAPRNGAERKRAVTRALREGTPLTPGQLAADALQRGLTTTALLAEAEDYLTHARASGRPVEPGLERRGRRQLLVDALRRADHLGVRDPVIERLAGELRSAHSTAP
ncbi:MAG: 1-acyl-sn-glycerol-3-phosphate acyltransferase [Actinomycetota bacterium]|nr:1-acyl-sn-glycerol-3-phosphate acyltransferase [Actinomycetota bacterium]